MDGGILKNFPVSTIREDCDVVIGVNAGPLLTSKYKVNIMDVASRTYHFIFRANTIADKEMCDIIIEPDNIYDFDLFETEKIMDIFDLGYETAMRVLKDNGL